MKFVRPLWEVEKIEKNGNATENVVTDKKGGQLNNKNAVGNEGGAPKKNKNAVTHGLFAKWLPEETAEIIKTIQNRSEVDML